MMIICNKGKEKARKNKTWATTYCAPSFNLCYMATSPAAYSMCYLFIIYFSSSSAFTGQDRKSVCCLKIFWFGNCIERCWYIWWSHFRDFVHKTNNPAGHFAIVCFELIWMRIHEYNVRPLHLCTRFTLLFVIVVRYQFAKRICLLHFRKQNTNNNVIVRFCQR